MISINTNSNLRCNNKEFVPSFSSRLNPVKPFRIFTSKGEVTVYEPNKEELLSCGFISKLVDFFTENLSKDTNDPNWLALGNKKNKHLIAEFKKQFNSDIKNLIKEDDGHLTITVAKDKNGEICAGCMSYGYDEVPMAKKNALYIENIAVNFEYRKNHIGDILIQKAVESAKKSFTDVFLVGENMASGFYEKLGFKKLNPKCENQKAVIDYIADIRWMDFPMYVSLYSKPIQPKRTRWYDISGPVLKNLFSNIKD